MHNCPNCGQELPTFVFYCPKCGRNIGKIVAENDLIALWWLDAAGTPQERFAKKSLVRRGSYVDPTKVSPEAPNTKIREVLFTIKGSAPGLSDTIGQSLLEVFKQVADPTQEWHI